MCLRWFTVQIRIHQDDSVKQTVKQYLTRNPNIPPAAVSSNYDIPARPTTPEEPKQKRESSPGLLSSLTFGSGRKTKDSKAPKTTIENGSRNPGEYLPGDPVWYLNYTQYWIRARVIKKMPHHDGVYKVSFKFGVDAFKFFVSCADLGNCAEFFGSLPCNPDRKFSPFSLSLTLRLLILALVGTQDTETTGSIWLCLF